VNRVSSARVSLSVCPTSQGLPPHKARRNGPGRTLQGPLGHLLCSLFGDTEAQKEPVTRPGSHRKREAELDRVSGSEEAAGHGSLLITQVRCVHVLCVRVNPGPSHFRGNLCVRA
jgi:hypothetical protein